MGYGGYKKRDVGNQNNVGFGIWGFPYILKAPDDESQSCDLKLFLRKAQKGIWEIGEKSGMWVMRANNLGCGLSDTMYHLPPPNPHLWGFAFYWEFLF